MTLRKLAATALFGMASITALFVPQAASAVECRICETYENPTELYELSARLGSKAVRHQVRSWLAEHRPDTPAGTAARGWMANEAGDGDTAARLYLDAVRSAPNLYTAAINASFSVGKQSGVEAANAILKPLIGNPDARLLPMWNTFFNLSEADRQDEAMRLLETWEREGTRPRWVPMAVRANLETEQNNRNDADQLYWEAMKQSDVINYHVFGFWLANRRTMEAQRGADTRVRRQTYDLAMELAARVETPLAYEKVGLYAREHLNDKARAYRARYEGVRLLALPELVAGAFYDVVNGNPDLAYEVLDRGLEDFPFNYDIAMTEIAAYSLFKIDPPRAEAAVARSLANAVTGETVEEVGSFVLLNRARLDDYDSAPAIMDELLPRVSGRDRARLLCAYVDNRIGAKDFSAARSALEECDVKGTSAAWVAKRTDTIEYFSALTRDRDQWLAAQPFLRDWEARFGGSLRAAIEFETGKSTILPESHDVIETAADALNAPGGEDYVFQIEGHTDSRGADTVNFPLSEARAGAVKDFLVTRLGLEAARIQTRGFGPDNPVAPNTTEAGRQENRRVEIRPLGNVKDPQIATPGAYNIERIDISKDGRIAVMGNSPTQVWDLERNVVLHEISAGFDHQISPNNRYLASSSSFRHRSGDITHTLYIYDLRSGKLVDFVKEEAEIGSAAWSPFSDRIVFSTNLGYVKIYDMARREVTAHTRLSTSRITAMAAWMNDGEDLVLKVGANQGDMHVVDPDTLRQKRVIRETGWFHAMGQSHDSRYLIASRNNKSFTIWDTTKDWTVVANGGLPLIARKIYTHPSKPWALLYAKFNSDTKVVLMDLTNGEILATSPLEIEGGGFSPDGDRFITGAGDEMFELDTRTLEIVSRQPGASPIGRDVHIFEDSSLVLSSDASGSAVWSLETGRRVHVFDTVPAGNWRAIPDQNWKVIGVKDDGHDLVVFDSRKFQVDDLWHTDDEITDLRMQDGLLVVATVPPQSRRNGAANPQTTLHVIDLTSMGTLHSIKADIVTAPLEYRRAFNFGASIDLDGNVIALRTAYADGFGHIDENSAVLQLFDLHTGRSLRAIGQKAPIGGFDLVEGGTQVKIRSTGTYSVYDVDSGTRVGTAPFDPLYAFDLEDGRKLRWFWDRVMLDDKVLTFPMSLRSLSLSERNNVLVGQTRTGKIHFIDLSRLQTALTIMPFSNGQWIAYTPSGTYTASLQGTEGVYWSLGDNYLPFDALADQFSRPSLVQDLLGKLIAGGLTDDDMRDAEVQPDTFDAPYQLDLVTPTRLSTSDDSLLVELKVRKDSADLPDPEFRYVLNGRQVIRSRGFEEEAFFEDIETVTVTRRFDLRPGANTIEASLIWNGAAVSTARIDVQQEITRDKTKTAKNALWFFGVGVVELKVRKDSADLPDPEFRYVLNGRQVIRSRGFEEEAFFEDIETVTVTRRFDLRPGANTIEASLIWNGAAVSTARIDVQQEITRDKTKTAKNALWFFGVGVSQYENASQNL
ncbi:OmpA family protein, partial [Oceaniglobus trochenteri]|uniref:OmpA family protein n=1 Tax=Oceaniglobus trochenteri TaxID=2763260 RepID=UPI001CFF9135